MSSTQTPTKIRLTPRERESSERRTRMTQRRQELTSQIRKRKKSKYLHKKRGLPCSRSDHPVANVDPSHTMAHFKEVIVSFCRNLTSLEQLLSTLKNFVSSTNNNAIGVLDMGNLQHSKNPLVILEQKDETLASNFLNHLREQSVESFANHETSSFETTLRILVYLTSVSSGDSTASVETEYYGRHPLTWSELLLSPNLLPSSQNSSTSPKPSWLEIFVHSLLSSKEVELTSLVIGNLVGDDSAARSIFQFISTDFKTSMIVGLIRSVSPATPTAAWTLTNMIRCDSVSYARTYCSEKTLSTSLLTAWLQEPSLATQTAWMVASLTAREEETVEYLCGKYQSKQGIECSFLSVITRSIENPSQSDQTLPLLQALGNIACHPSLVRPLLTQTTPDLIPLLQTILNSTPSRDPILLQGAWLAGCLLVDAGLDNHPSTTIAAPALIPILMNRLDGGCQTSKSMTCLTLEEERECASALWNALDAPPFVAKEQGQQEASLMNHSSRTFHSHLPLDLNVSRSTLRTLVRLIDSNDNDAVIAGVNVIHLILRRDDNFQSLQPIMQEEEIPDALERICDSRLEAAANVAADILDDFFYIGFEHQNEMVDAGASPSWESEPSAFERAATRNDNRLGRGRGRGATIPAWMAK